MKLWLVKPFSFELSDKYLRRAVLDYWQHLDYEILDDLPAMLEFFAGRRMWLFSKKAEKLYTDVVYHPEDVLVFGKETKGLPESLIHEHFDYALKIPVQPEARSLNLATAVAIGCYEMLRQIRQ